MGGVERPLSLTSEEYLAFERTSDQRLEYVDGAMVSTPRASREHSLVAQNIARELGNGLLERACEVHGSDMRIKVEAVRRYFYADVLVVCGAPVFEDETRDTLLNPKVIVEVLSESTERYDRGDKFASYRRLTSLHDYVLASQTEPLVEHYQRGTDGAWVYRALGPGERLVLASVGCEVPVERAYVKVFAAK